MEQLKPCPFCGGEAKTRVERCWHGVACSDENCVGSFIDPVFTSEESAIDAWNTRAERTCKVENGGEVPNWILVTESVWFCSDCGSPMYNDMQPSYCMYCGAKVVG